MPESHSISNIQSLAEASGVPSSILVLEIGGNDSERLYITSSKHPSAWAHSECRWARRIPYGIGKDWVNYPLAVIPVPLAVIDEVYSNVRVKLRSRCNRPSRHYSMPFEKAVDIITGLIPVDLETGAMITRVKTADAIVNRIHSSWIWRETPRSERLWWCVRETPASRPFLSRVTPEVYQQLSGLF